MVGYRRLVGQDYPSIQREIEAMHRQYPGPTVIEANSIGLPPVVALEGRQRQLARRRRRPKRDAPVFDASLDDRLDEMSRLQSLL